MASKYRRKSGGLQIGSSSLIKSSKTKNTPELISNIKNIFTAITEKIANFKPGKSKRISHVGRKKIASIHSAVSKKKLKKLLNIFGGVAFFTLIIGFLILSIMIKNINASLPEPGKLIDRKSSQSTIIYDRNGVELYKMFKGENRVYKRLDQYPKHTIAAVLAAEDAEFYQHKGIDWFGNVRCSILSLQSYLTKGKSGNLCGASTISQQLVRGTLMSDAFGAEAYDRSTFWRTVKRKLREILMTIQVEQTMTKDQMLEMYLNEVNLGGVNYGFEAGGQSLFGKGVEELSLSESAILAGLLPSPTRYNPLYGSQPEMAETRKIFVLDQLLKHKDTFKKDLNLDITAELIEQTKKEDVKYNPGKFNIKAPHFVWYVRDELVQMDNFDITTVESGGLRVYTTLDYETQKIAEEEILRGIEERGVSRGVKNAALVALTPQNGEIVAMVGSVDYWNTEDVKIDGNVNVTTSIRQMGSSFKPFTYLTAFVKGYTPGLEAPDLEEFDFNYDAGNWDKKFEGFMTAREALVKSRNIPALNTIQLLGVEAVLETTDKLGITTLTDRGNYGLSLTLGAGGQKLVEHVAAYGVFANEGVRQKTTSILRVENSKGEVIYQKDDAPGERVFDEKDIYLLNWTLCDGGGFKDQLLNENYTKNGKRIACGKTGTTNGPRDLLSIMYHKNLVFGIWAGNNDNSIIAEATSANVPLPMAKSFLNRKEIEEKYPSKLYSRPAGISTTKVCKDTGLESGDVDCDDEPTIFIKGKEPKKDQRQKVKICKNERTVPSNLAAAEKFDLVEEVTVLNYEFENEKQRDAFEEFVQDEEDYLLKMPESGDCKLPLGPNNEPIIRITSPATGSSFEAGSTITITVEAVAMESMASVQYKLDNSNIGGPVTSGGNFSFSYTTSSSLSTGTHTLSAVGTDNKGLSSTDSIPINITAHALDVSLSLDIPGAPTPGGTVIVTARVSGTNASSITGVTFSASGGTISNIKKLPSNRWSADWNIPAVASSGQQYTIVASTVPNAATKSATVTIP